jgi:lipid II:glycine glycyltransferase (peptidoglycan interpeptide bridge formation enzyme)
MTTTGERDAFGVHSYEYFEKAYNAFKPGNQAELLLATYEDQLLAGVMVFRSGHRAWYFYGASSDLRRETMPAYLLQWEAMRWAKGRGCTSYDLWCAGCRRANPGTQFTQRSVDYGGLSV